MKKDSKNFILMKERNKITCLFVGFEKLIIL